MTGCLISQTAWKQAGRLQAFADVTNWIQHPLVLMCKVSLLTVVTQSFTFVRNGLLDRISWKYEEERLFQRMR